MASKFETSQNTNKGSDAVYDVFCSVCVDDGIYKEGLFHCQKCVKTYCDQCVLMHKKLMKDHSVTTKCEGDNLPVTKTVDDTLEFCGVHTTQKLTMFCDDHEQLLCQVCHLRVHRQCSQVVLLADKVQSDTQCRYRANMAQRTWHLQTRLEDIMKSGERNINHIQVSYDRVINEILDLRKEINENLDRLQQFTIRELEHTHSSLKSSFEEDTKRCGELLSNLKDFDTKSQDNTTPERLFISYIKKGELIASAKAFLQVIKRNDAVDMEFQPNNELGQVLAVCSNLGKIKMAQQQIDPNTIFSIKDKSAFKIRAANDEQICAINGICETDNKELLINDYRNMCVKRLDQEYRVIETLEYIRYPCSICSISSNQFVVTVCDDDFVKEIKLFEIEDGEITLQDIKELHYYCYGIAYHDGELFVSSGDTVYQYTLDDMSLKKEIFVEKYGRYFGVAVSPDGKRIYVSNSASGTLRTLTRDGTVMAELHDPSLILQSTWNNVHVAATGQLFVSGRKSVSQVDIKGEQIIKTVNLIDDESVSPGYVFLRADSKQFLIGLWNADNLLKFNTHIS